MTAKVLVMTAAGAVPSPVNVMASQGYRAMGVPFYWKDEQSGELPKAVRAYFEAAGSGSESKSVSEKEMGLVTDYLVYWVHAPCWRMGCRNDDEMTVQLEELKRRSSTLASVESIRRWIEEAMDLGLDPF